MYLDSTFKVEEVLPGRVRLGVWPKRRRVCHLYDTDLNVEEDDIVRLCIENHSPDRGWVIDQHNGFPYKDSGDGE